MKNLAIERMNAEEQPEWFVSRIVSMNYVKHNSLEKAAWDHINRLDRWIVNVKDVDEFKKHVKETVERLNAEHTRCKPINLDTYNRQEGESGIERHDIDFYLSCNMHLKLYAFKGCAVNGGGIKVYQL